MLKRVFRTVILSALISLWGIAALASNFAQQLPTLDSLTISGGALYPAFDPNTTIYSLTPVVSDGTAGSIVTAIPTSPTATLEVSINGGSFIALNSGLPSPNLLFSGCSNVITVRVTDGTASQDYTMNVTRAQCIQGAQGPQGPQGEKGEKGDTGAQGLTGEKGAQGDVGAQGPQGLVGPQGLAGMQGPLGSKGDSGVQGPAGPQGAPGLGTSNSGDTAVIADNDGDGNGQIDFKTGDTTRFRINNDGTTFLTGNMGIGESNPTDARQVFAGPYPNGMVQKVKTSDGMLDFNFTQRGVANTGAQRMNQVMTWGWNIDHGGGGEKQQETGIGLSLESYYHPEGGNPLTEAHLFYINRAGQQFRPWSFVADQTDDSGLFAFKVDTLRIHSGTDPGAYAQFTAQKISLGAPTSISGGLTFYGMDTNVKGIFTNNGEFVFGNNLTSFPSIKAGQGAPSGSCVPGSLYLRRPDGVSYDSLGTCVPGGSWARVWNSVTLNISGTANRLPKFTNTSSLGNSLMADDGTSITLTSGNLLFGAGSNQDIGKATANRPRNLYLAGSATIGGGTAIKRHMSNAASLDFDSIPANSCAQLTITAAGAADGDVISLGVPSALASLMGVQVTGFVSSPNTVTVRACNITATATTNPPAVTVRISVSQY